MLLQEQSVRSLIIIAIDIGLSLHCYMTSCITKREEEGIHSSLAPPAIKIKGDAAVEMETIVKKTKAYIIRLYLN